MDELYRAAVRLSREFTVCSSHGGMHAL